MEEILKERFGGRVTITKKGDEYILESKQKLVLIKAAVHAMMLRGDLPNGKLVQENTFVSYKPYKK